MEIIQYVHQKSTIMYATVNRVTPETQLKDVLRLIGVPLVLVEMELNVRMLEIVHSACALQGM